MTSDKFDPRPLIMTDTDGNIIFINNAAHKMCADRCGGNIFTAFPTLPGRLIRARASGQSDFSLFSVVPPYTEFKFDISSEASDGVIRLSPLSANGTDAHIFTYEELAEEFRAASDMQGLEGARRTTRIYDTLISANSIPTSKSDPQPVPMRCLLTDFFDSALPSIRHIGHTLILRCDASVTDSSPVYCDPYSFFLMLAAASVAVGYAARGDIVIDAEHTGDSGIITVSANMRPNITLSNAASFGVHAPDVIFAETIAKRCGFALSFDTRDRRIAFSFRIPAGAYYSEYLKNKFGANRGIHDHPALSAVRLISL